MSALPQLLDDEAVTWRQHAACQGCDPSTLDTTRRYVEATANELRDAVRAHPSHLALQRHLTTTSEG